MDVTGAERFEAVDEQDELDGVILAARASVVAKLDAATDFDALLAGIYAAANANPAGGPDSATRC